MNIFHLYLWDDSSNGNIIIAYCIRNFIVSFFLEYSAASSLFWKHLFEAIKGVTRNLVYDEWEQFNLII